MRTARTLEDVNIILRDLWDFYDTWKGGNKDIDLHGRRFKNVGKHVDSTDFVRWDELPSFVPSITQTTRISKPIAAGTDIYVPITFGYGLGEAAVIKDHATPPFIWTNPKNGLPISWYTTANLPPLGSGFSAVIQLEAPRFPFPFYPQICTVSIPGNAGARAVLNGSIANVPTSILQQGDTVNLMVQAVGSQFGGQDIEIVILVKLL